MGRESGSWTGLREKLSGAGLRCRRFTERFDVGVPDVLWIERSTGKVGWLELKAVARYPVRGGPLDVGVSEAQTAWLYTWAMDHGRGGIMARITEAQRWLYWPASREVTWARQMRKDPLAVPHHVFNDPLNAPLLVSLLTADPEEK